MITLLYPATFRVSVSEFVGCWIAWYHTFKPGLDWRNNSLRWCNAAEVLPVTLAAGVGANGGHRVFSCDIILRSIAQAHGHNPDTMQATNPFFGANGNYLGQLQVPGLMNQVNGCQLTHLALNEWNALPRTDRQQFIQIGQQRLEFIFGVLSGLGIDVNGINIP